MPGFLITEFWGMAPAVSARLLTDSQSQFAMNCDLYSGELRAFHDALFVVTPTKIGTKKAIYRFGKDITNEAQYWFSSTSDVDYVRGPINNDTSERTLWTGENEPRITDNSIALVGGTDYPMNWYKLGVPKPAAAPTVANGGGGSGNPQDNTYIYTYVSGWGEEGPPSDPSPIITRKPGDAVTVGGMSLGPGAGYNIVSKRIYRSVTGNNATDAQFVAEIAVATASYVDSALDSTLNEVIKSRFWIPPPVDLKGLVDLSNGIIAGFSKQDVWMCEPFQPHAWPARYRKSTPYEIVGLGAYGSTLVALTNGKPYAGACDSPSNLSLNKIGEGQACVAKRGIVNFPGAVMYPSAEGLCMVSSAGWQALTSDVFLTREQWQAFKPESISAYRWKNRYVGFYDDGAGTQRGFIFNPMNPKAGLIYTDLYATAGYNDPQREALYLMVGADIKRWASAGTFRADQWKSKVFTMPRPINPAVAQVIAVSYPVTLKLYADSVLRGTFTVTSQEPFTLPGGYLARDFEVQLEGSGATDMRGVAVATSMEELQGLVT